jgi:hypothetical protein
MGHDRDVRQPPDLRSQQRYCGVQLQRNPLHRNGGSLPGRPNRRDVREGHKRLLLRLFDGDVHVSAVMRGICVWRGLLAYLQQHMHSRRDDVHLGWPRHVCAGNQRVLSLRSASRLWSAPKLHRRGRNGGVHLQHSTTLQRRWIYVREHEHSCHLHNRFSELPVRIRNVHVRNTPELHRYRGYSYLHVQHEYRLRRRRNCVRKLKHACDVHEGQSELRVRFLEHELREWCMQRRRLLPERVHAGPIVVRLRRPRKVHARNQRLLGARCARRLRSAGELHRACWIGPVHLQFELL